MLESSTGAAGGSKQASTAEEPAKTPSLAPVPSPNPVASTSSQPLINVGLKNEDDINGDKITESKQPSKKRRLPSIVAGRELSENPEELVIGEGKAIKKFKILHNAAPPFIYCEILPNVLSGKSTSGNEVQVSKVEFTIKPLTGTPFKVLVPQHGCLFDLYDAIFVSIQVPWERQLLSADGVVLPIGEAAMLSSPLPNSREINLAVRMSSGMESFPLNPDMSLYDFEDIDEEYEEYEEVIEFVEDGTQEIIVNLENLEEASKQLQSLVLEKIANVKIECVESSIADIVPPLSSSFDSSTTCTLLSNPPQSGEVVPKRLQGPAVCHFCRMKCRPALQFTCKCGQLFCHLHRYHDQHRCSIDIASIDRAGLSKTNPKVVKDRL